MYKKPVGASSKAGINVPNKRYPNMGSKERAIDSDSHYSNSIIIKPPKRGDRRLSSSIERSNHPRVSIH